MRAQVTNNSVLAPRSLIAPLNWPALAWNEQVAELSRQHGNSNLLVLPAQFVSEEQGVNILHKWLETNFEGGRHARRVEKIDK